ncbi:MAG: winged helix-turn-helix domain-containing protein [bacterium]
MRNSIKHFYEFGPFRLDLEKHRLLRAGEAVPLPPKAIEALLVLVRNPGKMLEREALMQAVWSDTFVEDANLTVAISHLRKALGQNGETVEYIETIPRVGYRFVADVRETSEEPVPLIIEKRTLSRTVIEEEVLQDEPQTKTSTEAILGRPSAAEIRPVSLSRNATASLIAVAALFALGLGAVLYFRSGDRKTNVLAGATPLAIRSIAVMPPKPLSPEADNASLSLGIADALITRLGAIRKVVVRPTSSVSKYVDSNQDPVAAGRALGVDAVLDGSFQRVGGRVRVTLRLLEVGSGTQLWAGNFEEADTDLFKLQDSISQQVAEALSPNLSRDEKALLTKRQTQNSEAYAAYLKGNYFWNKRGIEVPKGIEYFRKAIDLDPNFAQAYVGLAKVYATSTPHQVEAEALVEKALQLDNTLSEAHATQGFLRMFHRWDWAGASQALDRAIELDPNSSMAHHWKGVYLSLLGRLDEAKAEMQRALELDPLSLIIMSDIGQLYYFAREYDQAIEYCNRALTLDKEFWTAHVYLTYIYRAKGMEQQAFDEILWTRQRNAEPGEGKRLTEIFSRSGLKGVDKAYLERNLREGENKELPPISIAQLFLNAGDNEQALSRLTRSAAEREFLLPFISVDPYYDPLRAEPRFKEILHQLDLPSRS